MNSSSLQDEGDEIQRCKQSKGVNGVLQSLVKMGVSTAHCCGALSGASCMEHG